MKPHDTTTSVTLSARELLPLSKEQILDLLEHKTNLLMIASRMHRADHADLLDLKNEVQTLQQALKDHQSRTTDI